MNLVHTTRHSAKVACQSSVSDIEVPWPYRLGYFEVITPIIIKPRVLALSIVKISNLV